MALRSHLQKQLKVMEDRLKAKGQNMLTDDEQNLKTVLSWMEEIARLGQAVEAIEKQIRVRPHDNEVADLPCKYNASHAQHVSTVHVKHIYRPALDTSNCCSGLVWLELCRQKNVSMSSVFESMPMQPTFLEPRMS